jgi:hypothetical protein
MIRIRGMTSMQGTAPEGFGFGPAGRWYQFVLLAIVFALWGLPSLYAQHSKPKEYEVKAAYLFNFGRFVEWPTKIAATKGDTFAICVLGQDPFGAALDATIAGETIAGKNVVARRILKPQDALNCRVLFVSSSEESRLKDILPVLHDASILTVSDIPQFTRRGGMIQFTLEGSRVRFEVNLTPAQEAGLTLSSELLKVAVAVIRNSQPGD